MKKQRKHYTPEGQASETEDYAIEINDSRAIRQPVLVRDRGLLAATKA